MKKYDKKYRNYIVHFSATHTFMENFTANENYQVGDIVSFYMFKQAYVGQIKEYHGPYNYVKIELVGSVFLIALENCDRFKYRDYHEDWCEDHEDESEGKLLRVKRVMVDHDHLRFSIKREDINRYLQSKSEGERFKLLLRGFWKDFVVRKVKTVVLPPKELGLTRYTVDIKYGMVKSDMLHETNPRGATFEERYTGVDETADTFYMKYYSKYFGFTFKFGNDDKEIYFSMDNYKGLDFDVDHTCWFSGWGNHNGGYTPPERGDFVCGIVKKNSKGLYYDEWFTCSPRFFNFWKFIMSNGKVTEKQKVDLLSSAGQSGWFNHDLTTDQHTANLPSYKKIARQEKRYADDGYYPSLIEYILTGAKPSAGSDCNDTIRKIARNII